MAHLAPLSELASHLCSPDAEVRRTALQHVEAHGPAARALAPEVARMLDDPDAGVQYFAMGAFRSIGAGAAPALPMLLEHAIRRGAPSMLRTRALFCIGVVGPAAHEAIEPLLTLATEPDARGDAIEALVAIAPPAPQPRIGELVAGALFDVDYATRNGVARALPEGPSWLVDRALDVASERAEDPEHDMSAMGIVLELAPRAPERALPLIVEAIVSERATAGLAMLALERMDAPITQAVGRAMLRAAARGDDRAADTLERVAARLPRAELAVEARALLVPRLVAAADLRTAAACAKALAVLAPKSAEVIAPLIEILRQGLASDKPGWYGLGDVAEALGALSDDASGDRVAEALGEALARSRAHIRRDESAVLDFQRAVRRGLEPLEQRSRRARASTPSEAELVDAEHARMDEVRARPTLPPIPAPLGARRPRLRAPARAALAELDRARHQGALILAREGVDASIAPDRIAEIVDVEVRTMRREGRRDIEAVPPLAALYGDAIVRELGWRWRLWAHRDVRALAVVAPGSTHAVLPGKLVRAKLEPGAQVTLLLLFRMMVAGQLPASQPGALTLLG